VRVGTLNLAPDVFTALFGLRPLFVSSERNKFSRAKVRFLAVPPSSFICTQIYGPVLEEAIIPLPVLVAGRVVAFDEVAQHLLVLLPRDGPVRLFVDTVEIASPVWIAGSVAILPVKARALLVLPLICDFVAHGIGIYPEVKCCRVSS